MVRQTTSEINLPSLSRALAHHRRAAVGVFAAVLAVTAVWTALAPRSYQAEGKLFIRLGRENALIDATATLGRESIVAVPQSRDNEMNSVVELMQSRGLVEAVVDAVTPAALLSGVVPSSAKDGTDAEATERCGAACALSGLFSAAGRCLAACSPMPELDQRERAVLLVQRKLKVEGVKRSNVVQLRYEAATPELARMVVARVIECYLQEHIRLNRTGGAREFLGQQANHARDELNAAEEELRQLKSRTGLVSPASQREILVQRVGRLEEELLENASEQAASRRKLQQLRQTMAGLPAKEVTNEAAGMPDQGTDEMRSQFYALQLQEQAARARYTEDHPRLKEVLPQTREARRILAEEKYSRNHVTTAPSRVAEEVRVAAAMQEAQLAALEAKADGVRRQLADVRRDLQQLADGAVQIAKIEREFERRESEYRKYALSLEQARIDDALERQRISNISVAQEATCSLKPHRPRMALNLGLGLVVAAMSGVGVAVVREMRDRRLRTPAEVEQWLRLPVLATIPRWRGAAAINGRN